MADYRYMKTSLWDEEWFYSFNDDERVFFIYLSTNKRGSASGLYRIPIRAMVADLGYTAERIREILTAWQGKYLEYDEPTSTIFVYQMRESQSSESESMKKRISKDIDLVPWCPPKESYCRVYGIDTVSQHGVDTVSTPSKNTVVTPQLDTVSTPIRTDNDNDNDNEDDNSSSFHDKVLIDRMADPGIDICPAADDDGEGLTPYLEARYPLCKRYSECTGRSPTENDRRLDADIKSRDDWDCELAIAALDACHSRAQESGRTPKSLSYYRDAIIESLTLGEVPARRSGGNGGGRVVMSDGLAVVNGLKETYPGEFLDV